MVVIAFPDETHAKLARSLSRLRQRRRRVGGVANVGGQKAEMEAIQVSADTGITFGRPAPACNTPPRPSRISQETLREIDGGHAGQYNLRGT
jgi:hypothetical protein